jgi:hypothetical protein
MLEIVLLAAVYYMILVLATALTAYIVHFRPMLHHIDNWETKDKVAAHMGFLMSSIVHHNSKMIVLLTVPNWEVQKRLIKEFGKLESNS